jgi:hypothetical protein
MMPEEYEMRKISVDFIRLAVSSAAICAVVGVAESKSLRHDDASAAAKTRIASPIRVKAISVGAPALCWTIEAPVGVSSVEWPRNDLAAIAQTCSIAPPNPRGASEPLSRLALAR